VPEGHYFMMGDNRDNSQDSRYWGFMPREYVKGKALFVYFSFGEGGSGLSGLLGNVRWGRILHQIH
jgi:signal peptidase I